MRGLNSKRPIRIRLRQENLRNLKRQVDQLVEKCGEDAKVSIDFEPVFEPVLNDVKYYLEATPSDKE